MNLNDHFTVLLAEAGRYRKQYEGQISELIQKAKLETTRMEYGKGGTTLHRGYYCPGLAQDLIVGNMNRGKLLKRWLNAPDYCYYFDASDKLRLSENKTCTEVILYENNREVGLAIDSQLWFYRLSLCDYADGVLQRYCRFDAAREGFFGFYTEDYQTRDGFLTDAVIKNVQILSKKNPARKTVEDTLERSTLTQQQREQILFGDFFLSLHLIAHFKNDGERLVSYTLEELPRRTVTEHLLNTGQAV